MNLYQMSSPDGPTTYFYATKVSDSIINIYGLLLIALILIPNGIYALKNRGQKNQCTNHFLNIIEQIGRYSCMFLMVFHIGIWEFGYRTPQSFLIYLIGNAILLLAYWVYWILYFRKRTLLKGLVLAVIPTAIFLLCGLCLRQYPLVVSAVIFGIGHIYVTFCNHKTDVQ